MPTGTGAAGGGTVTTTTVASASAAVSNVSSQNWSGYSVTGGAFGAAQGTFTVPELSPTTTCTQDTSEWVGVDGFSVSGSDTDLIQAGVDESPIDPYTGVCTPGTFYVVPWWEILPAAETPISTMTVNAGDVVSVQLSQLSSSEWSIAVADETDGQSFSTQQAYSGPATSAEWIVEAPMDSTNCGGICGLAPYCVPSGQNCTSPVTFSAVQANGPQGQWWAISMDQGAGVVSAPSNLAGGTFTVSYSPSTAGAFVPSGSAVRVHPASALRVVAPSMSGGPRRPGTGGTSPLSRGWAVYQG